MCCRKSSLTTRWSSRRTIDRTSTIRRWPCEVVCTERMSRVRRISNLKTRTASSWSSFPTFKGAWTIHSRIGRIGSVATKGKRTSSNDRPQVHTTTIGRARIIMAIQRKKMELRKFQWSHSQTCQSCQKLKRPVRAWWTRTTWTYPTSSGMKPQPMDTKSTSRSCLNSLTLTTGSRTRIQKWVTRYRIWSSMELNSKTTRLSFNEKQTRTLRHSAPKTMLLPWNSARSRTLTSPRKASKRSNQISATQAPSTTMIPRREARPQPKSQATTNSDFLTILASQSLTRRNSKSSRTSLRTSKWAAI